VDQRSARPVRPQGGHLPASRSASVAKPPDGGHGNDRSVVSDAVMVDDQGVDVRSRRDAFPAASL